MLWPTDPTRAALAKRSRQELIEAVVRNYVWRKLAMADIRTRYRRAILGPFWITLTTGAMALAIGVIYGQFFGQAMSGYLPYVTTGLIIWIFISSALAEGSNAFISAASLIRSSNLPLVFHVMRTMHGSFIAFLHNALIIIIVWLFLPWNPDLQVLLLLPGFAILYIFLAASAIMLAIVCVRYRDVPPMVQAAMQFLFFASPVIWLPENLRVGSMILHLNPFAYLLAVTRDPLLGRPVSVEQWLVALGCAILAAILASIMYVRYRDRVAYWT